MTPRKFGSWPPEDSAPRSTGSEPSGAVRSSWIGNRLMALMAMPQRERGAGCAPPAGVAARLTEGKRTDAEALGQDGRAPELGGARVGAARARARTAARRTRAMSASA